MKPQPRTRFVIVLDGGGQDGQLLYFARSKPRAPWRGTTRPAEAQLFDVLGEARELLDRAGKRQDGWRVVKEAR